MLRGNRQTPRELVLSVIGDELYEHGYPASEGTAGSLILALTRKEVTSTLQVYAKIHWAMGSGWELAGRVITSHPQSFGCNPNSTTKDLEFQHLGGKGRRTKRTAMRQTERATKKERQREGTHGEKPNNNKNTKQKRQRLTGTSILNFLSKVTYSPLPTPRGHLVQLCKPGPSVSNMDLYVLADTALLLPLLSPPLP